MVLSDLQMVEEALRAGAIRTMVEQVYVADAVRKYKPATEIYHGLLKAVGKETAPHEVWLVSGWVVIYSLSKW